eukprot:2605285-Prymnesium_polylepis.1
MQHRPARHCRRTKLCACAHAGDEGWVAELQEAAAAEPRLSTRLGVAESGSGTLVGNAVLLAPSARPVGIEGVAHSTR